MDLFNSNIDLVNKIVNKMNYGYISRDDLMQAGLMGLFFASKNYIENEKTKFTTFATYYIIGEIKKELRTNKLIKLNKKIYRIIRVIKENEELSVDDISSKFGFDKESILDAFLFLNDPSSLDKENQENETERLSLVPDKDTKKSSIFDALESLDEVEQNIIKLRYFNNYTQTDLVEITGKNQSKISRIENKALQKMRKLLLGKCL